MSYQFKVGDVAMVRRLNSIEYPVIILAKSLGNLMPRFPYYTVQRLDTGQKEGHYGAFLSTLPPLEAAVLQAHAIDKPE